MAVPTDVVQAARRGDEDAYRRLLDAHRAELHAHCYRMLGSVHDAEDALQEVALRVWRSLPRFEGRSSLRTWLYTIATNVCLNQIARRPRRVLPIDHGPPTPPEDGPGEPLVESVWLEPYPDAELGVADGRLAPEARYEQRESLELAFVAAMQHLPATQRAVLIQREVLGFSAREVADALDTSVASVNSALQRARRTVEDKLPEESQQATLRRLGDRRLKETVERYMDAMMRADVDRVVAMLTEDAAWSMPPLASWFGPRDRVRGFLERGPLSGAWRWRHLPTTCNGQATSAVYSWVPEHGAYVPFALDVLTFAPDGRIRDVTAFITRATPDDADRGYFAVWPAREADPSRLRTVFGAFGLPARLDA